MHAQQRIAVAGATGRVGRHIVDVLHERGHDVVPIARAHGVDVITGDGLADALTGVQCIIDAATGPSPDEQDATTFFTTASGNLQAAGDRAGVGRLVVVSIIAADRFTAGYGAATAAHERAALTGPIPARVLRAAQFHEFVGQLVAWGTQGDTAYVRKMRTQLVAARTVAEALVDLAVDPAWAAVRGATPPPVQEVAGPREERLADAATHLVAHRGDALKIVDVDDPSDPDDGLYESGDLLPGPGARLAGPTFEQWLDATGGR
jgi:uncharacterized protein YbjT (DUF2867 family)